MSIVFTSQTQFDPYPGEYSFDNWNRAIVSGGAQAQRIIGHLAKGNFYRFMSVLLDFEFSSEHQMFVPKVKHRLNR